MRIFTTIPPVATASALATFTLADWQRSVAEFALYSLIPGILAAMAIIAVAHAEPATRAARADWHTRRAHDLGHRSAGVSGFLSFAVFVFIARALVVLAHSLRAEGLGL